MEVDKSMSLKLRHNMEQRILQDVPAFRIKILSICLCHSQQSLLHYNLRPIKFRIITEETHGIFVATCTSQILLDSRFFPDIRIESVKNDWKVFFSCLHLFRKSEMQSRSTPWSVSRRLPISRTTHPSTTCHNVVSAYVSLSPTRYLP